jgi:hypothetical protein
MLKQVDNSLLIPVPNHSTHNLDSQTLTTTAFAKLTPVFCMETVPGGSYTISSETLCRFQPLMAPLMHKMMLKTHYFYVPYRTIWDNWENFIMGRKDPLTDLLPVHPFFPRSLLTTAANGKTVPELADYFGMTQATDPLAGDYNMNPFAFAAYQSIYNWYYRHKAVKDEITYKLEDGEIAPLDLEEIYGVMRLLTFEDDYFTSALPTPQEGGPVFVDTDAPVYQTSSAAGEIVTDVPGTLVVPFATPNPNDAIDEFGTSELFAKTRILVEEIRRAAKLQEYVELNNHAKTYIDWLKGHFNVDLQDYRLGIPEYITGFSQPVLVSDVINQSDGNQGRITGSAASYATSPKQTYYAREHGVIIGVAALTYKSSYIHAIPRLHIKTGQYDYFNPMFDSLGEQVLKNIEIASNHTNPDAEFGYVPRHHEYRSSFDYCTGEAKTTLASWHLGRGYHHELELTEDFYDVLDDRRIFVFQDPTRDPVILQVYNNIRAVLPLGQVARPTL